MGCNCKWTEVVLAVVILVFAYLEGVSGANMWIIVIAAVLLLIHALTCKNCAMCSTGSMPMKSGKKKKRR